MGYGHHNLTAGTTFREESIVHSFSVAGDVIIKWSRDFKKSPYLQKWRSYSH